MPGWQALTDSFDYMQETAQQAQSKFDAGLLNVKGAGAAAGVPGASQAVADQVYAKTQDALAFEQERARVMKRNRNLKYLAAAGGLLFLLSRYRR